ncbi:MAG: hypothetical protein AAGD38_17450 [Acidobacteriota bacterium]
MKQLLLILLILIQPFGAVLAQSSLPPPPADQDPPVDPLIWRETRPTSPPVTWLPHSGAPIGQPAPPARTTTVITLPESVPHSGPATSPPQEGWGWDPAQSPRINLPNHSGEQPSVPSIESTTAAVASRALVPGAHIREFDGESFTGSFPPDTVLAVGSQHVVQAVNLGVTIYNKLGTEVQGYRTFNDFFSQPSSMFLFDPKIVWSPFHNKYVMLVLGRDTNSQISRFYLAVSKTSNALGDWWWWWFDAESLGDDDAWFDFASVGSDPFGVYVTGNMNFWAGGNKRTKLWAISPQVFNGGPANNWVWQDLQWPSGALAFSPEVAHAHTSAFDRSSYLVNIASGSGDQALLWRIVGDRHSGAGLSLSRFVVDIDDYDAQGQSVQQPGGATPLHGGWAAVGNNALYSNRNVIFSLATDFNDDGRSGALLTYRLSVDALNVVWSDLLWPGQDRYYMYPAVALRGPWPDGHLAVYYTYTGTPDGIFASAGFKLYDNQPVNDAGPNQLYQQGLEENVRLDGQNRNRWGDYSGASYDWQCGHLWGVAEYAGIDDRWRTRIKAISGNGEDPCPKAGITFPVGPETFTTGSTQRIEWDIAGLPTNAQIVVFYDDGYSVQPISPFLSPGTTHYSWTVPSGATTEGRIAIGAWDGQQYVASDWSDFPFTVVDKRR